MGSKITNDNLALQIKISHHVFFPEVSTAITLFFPNIKTTRFMLYSTIPSFLKNEKALSTNFLLVTGRPLVSMK
jgi:hypothetical protein